MTQQKKLDRQADAPWLLSRNQRRAAPSQAHSKTRAYRVSTLAPARQQVILAAYEVAHLQFRNTIHHELQQLTSTAFDTIRQ